MPRTCASCRVSTAAQTTETQVHKIEAAGFKTDHRRVISETVSGSSAIRERLATGANVAALARELARRG